MIAFITGGTSFIGQHLINMLLKMRRFSEIRVLFRKNSPVTKQLTEMDETIILVRGDITKSSEFRDALKDVTHVFHLASLASDRASFQELLEVNVEGTKSFLETLRDVACRSLDFFFLMSSTGVYGTKLPINKPITEDFPKKPSHPYHVTKWKQEQACWEARNEWELPLVIFRPPMTLGPGDYKTFPTMVKAVQKNKFPIIGNGKNILTLMDVRDLVKAVELAMMQPQESIGEAFNLYSFQVTLEELHQEVRRVAGVSIEPKRVPYWLAYAIASLAELKDLMFGTKSTLNRYRIQKFSMTRLYDNSKIRRKLKFKPQHDLQATLSEAWKSLIQGELLKNVYE